MLREAVADYALETGDSETPVESSSNGWPSGDWRSAAASAGCFS